ncbi:hypothetical protein BN946_scf184470.g22 [Trametes cinnabarina]|uniref:C2H2-type domain-containing protein n=1 Tax=Pycnoporus cinnabarinus TaxID=5643 RepID=A0A060SVP5_PYCCI|nr:hypothetical protein BN946_scf184470.g22 [Trametes cinnabarina]
MAWCDRCDRYFSSEHALWQHEENSSMHNICRECNKDFASPWALKQHYVQSPRHPYCQVCEILFDAWDELDDHYNEDHHFCDDCRRIFNSESGLHEHRRQSHAERYCVDCKRMFRNANNLDQHRRSAVHQGRTVTCPMRGCGKAFVSNAALILHLESGGCVSRMNREQINRIMERVDRGNIITNPSRLITGGSSGERVLGQWATDRAWNGAGYECYLCHRTYRSLPALNQHLQSAAHAERIYRCPTNFYGCGTEFPTLSAFCQHVEAGRCGVCRFRRDVDRVLEGLSNGMKRLTMG